jgi:hypothetical protein
LLVACPELVVSFAFSFQVVERVGLVGLFRTVFAEEVSGFGLIVFDGPI